MIYESSGKLSYGPGIRAVIYVDPGIVAYYRSLIPPHFKVNRQRYDGHITVVRTGKELPTSMEVWGKHQDRYVSFRYDSEIKNEGVYWFLDIHSKEIGDIREELGLPRFRFADRPCYHLSLANTKTDIYHEPRRGVNDVVR